VNSYPDHTAAPSIFVPVPRFYPGQDAVRWKDLSPRLGVAYDLFGDGKTALKPTASHYVLGYAQRINPILTNRVNNRSWTDRDNDFFPDGDPLNPNRNGELGPGSNRDFTNPRINTFYDPDWAFGFGQRPANWEFSGSIQRELMPGLSVEAGYFRRVYTNFELESNRAVGPDDVDYFSVTVPVDPRPYCDNISVSSVTGGSTLGGSSEPWLTQVKFLGSYTLPYDVQVAATYQTFPGRERVANVTFRNAAVQPSLGRPLSATTSVLVNVIEPGTVYSPRLHQLDLRFTKMLNLGGTRLRGMLDLYNIFNDNTPLTFPAAFNPADPAAWERPGTILPARVFKLNLQLDF
jgi:hypothetical protein